MSTMKKRVITFAVLTYLLFEALPTSALEQIPVQNSTTKISHIKTTLVDFGKDAGKFVISGAQQSSGFMFICGLVLAAAGSYTLLMSILQNLPRLIGSTAMVGTGVALVLLANKKLHPQTTPVCKP